MDTKLIVAIAVGVVAVLALPLLLANTVTMANYENAQMDMSYEQVKDILGAGKTMDEIDPPKMKEEDLPPGVPMPSEAQIKQAQQAMKRQFDAMGIDMYVWRRGEDKEISVILQDGKVVGKTQRGLAERPSHEFKGMGPGGLPGMPGGMPGPGMPMPGMPPM